MPKISLFIPTFNAMSHCKDVFLHTLEVIRQANFFRVLIIDSSSTDDTVEITKQYGFETHVIKQEDFDHGGTRSLGFKMLSDSEIIIYITQDVFIPDINSFQELVKPLLEKRHVVSCYGRQIPHNNADIFARHLRSFNYGNTSYIRSYSDRFVYGMKCIFTSDSFCAYKVSALKAIKGFPEHIIFGEDVYVYAKLLLNGYSVAYNANAICKHSHNYKIKTDMKRYFDMGVFHRSESWILQEFGGPSKQGIKFTISELKYLSHKFWLWPKSLVKLSAKYIGYKTGLNYDKIGVTLCRKLTMNKSFWQ